MAWQVLKHASAEVKVVMTAMRLSLVSPMRMVSSWMQRERIGWTMFQVISANRLRRVDMTEACSWRYCFKVLWALQQQLAIWYSMTDRLDDLHGYPKCQLGFNLYDIYFQDMFELLRDECREVVEAYSKLESRNIFLNNVVATSCFDLIEKECKQEVLGLLFGSWWLFVAHYSSFLGRQDWRGQGHALLDRVQEWAQRGHGWEVCSRCRALADLYSEGLEVLCQLQEVMCWWCPWSLSAVREDADDAFFDVTSRYFFRTPKSKAEVLTCLSQEIQKNYLENAPQAVSERCRKELKFELLQQHSDIKLNKAMVSCQQKRCHVSKTFNWFP